jgi:hypothetical protein
MLFEVWLRSDLFLYRERPEWQFAAGLRIKNPADFSIER